MFVVDTNILIYAVDRESPDHSRCRECVDAWRNQVEPWYLTWGIVYEFLRVATHPRVFRKPLLIKEAWQFVNAVLAAPTIHILTETDRHRHVTGEVFSEVAGIEGNLVFDAHTAILMRENGLRVIYTRDSDFNRFPFLEVVDPVTNLRRTTRLSLTGLYWPCVVG